MDSSDIQSLLEMSQVAHFYCRASQPQQVELRASDRSLSPAVTETGRDRIRLVDDHLGYEWPLEEPKHNLAVTPLLLAATIDRIPFSLPHSIRNYAFLNASCPGR
jgi:hypothetical protein